MTGTDPAFQTKANPQQLEAILATDGPVLIIAGPGSGKTFTLVERIVYLITQKGVAPESLFVVTFTDKAARELTTRISHRLAELSIKCWPLIVARTSLRICGAVFMASAGSPKFRLLSG